MGNEVSVNIGAYFFTADGLQITTSKVDDTVANADIRVGPGQTSNASLTINHRSLLQSASNYLGETLLYPLYLVFMVEGSDEGIITEIQSPEESVLESRSYRDFEGIRLNYTIPEGFVEYDNRAILANADYQHILLYQYPEDLPDTNRNPLNSSVAIQPIRGIVIEILMLGERSNIVDLSGFENSNLKPESSMFFNGNQYIFLLYTAHYANQDVQDGFSRAWRDFSAGIVAREASSEATGHSETTASTELKGNQQSDDQVLSCPGLLPSRLIPSRQGRVETSSTTPNRMRDRPSLNGNQVALIPSGDVFLIIDGPNCNDGYAWYQVNYKNQIGWTAESGDGRYWLEPLE